LRRLARCDRSKASRRDSPIETYDGLEIRCRLLGHAVPFRYCRRVAEGLPCRLVLDCWHERFPVDEFLRRHYSPEQIQRILAPPKPKLTSLVELIEQARRRVGQDG